MKSSLILFLSLNILINSSLIAQNSNPDTGGEYSLFNKDHVSCLSEYQYDQIWTSSNLNAEKLKLKINNTRNNQTVKLAWPLRASAGLHDCSYYFISAHVDHDPSSQTFKDYNCGTITYDGHRGTDIGIWPFPFFKMDNDLVEVVAAANGIIVDKHDGEFDKNCAGVGSGLTPNYIVIQHEDGSRALYLHMKKNSLTAKLIGDSISKGEYLGIVASSGSSTGPHLHFEIWTGNSVNTYIDPFAGNCNLKNDSTWWEVQKPYTEPGLLKASVHTTDVVLPPCPETENINEDSIFQIPFQGIGLAPGYAKFYIYLRNETAGTKVQMQIINPDGSIFNSWEKSCVNNYSATYWGYSRKLPEIEGSYLFSAIYNADTCTQTFKILKTTSVSTNNKLLHLIVSPNPNSNSNDVILEFGRLLKNASLEIYNEQGILVSNYSDINKERFEIKSNIMSKGMNFIVILENNIIVASTKLIITR